MVNKVNSHLADDLMQTTKLIFAEYGPRVSKNFTSETFKGFCRKMNIQQTITLSYNTKVMGIWKHVKMC